MSKPIQYTKGYVEFYKLKFKVTPDVLIPRPETELLVDEVLRFLATHPERATRVEGSQIVTILDIGTGAGNIAISIAKNLLKQLPTFYVGIQIIATEISKEALKVAQQNAKLHGVANKITFVQSDLLSVFLNAHDLRFHLGGGKLKTDFLQDIDIIVTNLPYIPSARIPYLDPSVKDFEPHVALDGGEDGFALYRELFQQITDKGWLPKLIIGEVDYTHGELAVLEAQKSFPDARIEVKKDLAHLQRVLLVSA